MFGLFALIYLSPFNPTDDRMRQHYSIADGPEESATKWQRLTDSRLQYRMAQPQGSVAICLNC